MNEHTNQTIPHTTPTKVAALVGMSFCGSTVINNILGAHDEIYGASEIYYLFKESNQPEYHPCIFCGEKCPILNRDNVASLSFRTFYADLARISKKRCVADTSKLYAWFERSFAAQAPGSFDPILIVAVKHPMRHLASFFVNHPNHLQTSGLKSRLKRMLLDPRNALDNTKLHLSYWMDVMLRYYAGIFKNPLLRNHPHHVVRYEEIITNTKAALSPILDFLDVPYQEKSRRFWEHPKHYVGGNAGAFYNELDEKVKQKVNERFPSYRKNFYSDYDRLKVDDKYKKTFDEKLIHWIMSQKRYKMLCKILEYDERILES